MASKACNESEGSVLQKVQPPKLKKAGAQPGGVGVPVQPAGLPLTKTNLKLMTVLSNSCTVFTGQVIQFLMISFGVMYIPGFMRRWISNYSKKVEPLNALTKKGVKFNEAWGEEHDKAVAELKTALTTYPVLRQYDPNRPSVIVTDASDYAVGAALCQLYDKKLCAVAYASRCLKGPERNYSVQEKEALGTVFGVKKFRHYILHTKFQVRLLSDHESLKFLKTQDRTLVGRMARWAMYLNQYDLEIKYIKGSTNTLPDALSRNITTPDEAFSVCTSLLMLYPETHRSVMTTIVHGGVFMVTTNEGVHTFGEGESQDIAHQIDDEICEDKDTQREAVLFAKVSKPALTPLTIQPTTAWRLGTDSPRFMLRADGTHWCPSTWAV